MVMIELESVDCCPVCGGIGTFDIENRDTELDMTIRIYSCDKCHTAYHNPRLSQNSTTEYYSSGKYRDMPCRKIDEKTSARRIAATIGLIDAFTKIKPERCLDVGCSRGYLSRAIHERYGAEVVGYDIYKDPQAVIEVVGRKCDIEGTFDIVTCIHVLEHFYKPMDELTWMAGMLNPNGMLVIEIPIVRVVTPPHPVIFSREAVPILMKHIDANYIFMDMQTINIGYILAWKNRLEVQ